jgi:DNA-binding transcriptional MerR regulator
MPNYSPGEAADRTGFSLDTLRYYERIGLLDAVARTSGGQRLFTDGDLAWLSTLRCLRDTGMPIAKMSRYAELCRDDSTAKERLELLAEHDREAGERIAELQAQRAHVQAKIRWYQAMLEEPADATS